MLLLVCIATICLSLIASAQEPRASSISFVRDVAPILSRHCLACHEGIDSKAGLDVSTRQQLIAGGENGTALVEGNAVESLVWQQIESDTMPPKGKLSAEQKQTIKTWIDQGARWESGKLNPYQFSSNSRAGLDWWSLQPLVSSKLGVDRQQQDVVLAIDQCIDDKLHSANLRRSLEASRSVLVRRLYFDLLGLPPSPEEVKSFVEDDSSDSFSKLVDKLLASPHYGERWARHWLDIVKFGESNGFEYDEPRDHFWHYRNWVIESLNKDMPYDEFVRLQIAGDILHPNDAGSVAAVGFLVCGPHNTTLPANDLMRKSMAQDELEDLVGTVAQTFLGLTANCSRCHNHKFDPISQENYYQFAALLKGVGHGERTVSIPRSSEHELRLAQIDSEILQADQKIESIVRPIREDVATAQTSLNQASPLTPVLDWNFGTRDFALWVTHKANRIELKLNGSAKLSNGQLIVDGKDGYASTGPIPFDVGEKTLEAWVQLDDLEQGGGAAISLQSVDGNVFDAIVFGELQPRRWMAGSNGFTRTKSFEGLDESEADKKSIHLAICYRADGTVECYRNGVRYGQVYQSGGLQRFAAGKSQLLIGLRHAAAGGNRLLRGRVDRVALYDRVLSEHEIAASYGTFENKLRLKELLATRLSNDDRLAIANQESTLVKMKAEKQSILATEIRRVYTCVPSNPEQTRVLRRGEVTSPGQIVAPQGLSLFSKIKSDFGLSPDASDAQRRLELARWISDRDNPLFARVIVNRIWQYHFGQGLVATPSDFGFNGGAPSHPELLDLLAIQFRDRGFSLKSLHRLILNSETYKQSSKRDAESLSVDVNNRLLWRFSPRRLDAEEVRDAILLISGLLNHKIGDRGYRDTRHVQFKGSNFFNLLDEAEADDYRRTVYRFVPRGGRNPFLDTFDCPDPSASAPRRAATVTPLQSLALLNNSLIFKASTSLAVRLERDGIRSSEAKVETIYQLLLGRSANQDEVVMAESFVSQHGLEAFCRVMFNSNEFLHVR